MPDKIKFLSDEAYERFKENLIWIFNWFEDESHYSLKASHVAELRARFLQSQSSSIKLLGRLYLNRWSSDEDVKIALMTAIECVTELELIDTYLHDMRRFRVSTDHLKCLTLEKLGECRGIVGMAILRIRMLENEEVDMNGNNN